VRSFLSDRSAEKRRALVERLLASEDYAVHWSLVWMRILRTDEPLNGAQTILFSQLQPWLQEQFARNRPWDEIVRDLLLAEGTSDDRPEIAYLGHVLATGPDGVLDAMQNVSSHFLGYSISCARCHDHPFASWTQDDFYAWAAYLEGTALRVRRLNLPEPGERPQFEFTLTSRGRRPRLVVPDRHDPVRPRFLGESEPDASVRRRESLARKITARDNLQFGRAVVNRYWTILFGRGIVHPADGFQDNNPPAHPELLDELARRFLAHGCDIRWLLTAICSSQVYQRSCRLPPGADGPDERNYSHARMRPMNPAQLIRSASTMLGLDTSNPQRYRLLGALRGGAELFDLDPDDIESYKISLQQVLAIMHGPRLSAALERWVARLVGRHRGNDEAALEEMFLSMLSRPPDEQERAAFLRLIRSEHGAGRGSRRGAQVPPVWSDIAWAIVNSSEFILIH
jgi:hypothetical protein